MLSQDNMMNISRYFFLFIIFTSCSEKPDYYSTSLKKANIPLYNQALKSLTDSFGNWVTQKTNNVTAEITYKYQVDSLLCFNSAADRFITCRHLYVGVKESSSDDLQTVFGEKINNNWYYFKGSSVSIPRSMVSGHPINTPLSYQQLHQIALKEIYSSYLKKNGEINENWFTSLFESPGWGTFNNQASMDFILKGKRFTNKKEFFEFCHLTVVKANWNGVNRDSIKQLPVNGGGLP